MDVFLISAIVDFSITRLVMIDFRHDTSICSFVMFFSLVSVLPLRIVKLTTYFFLLFHHCDILFYPFRVCVFVYFKKSNNINSKIIVPGGHFCF